VCKPKNDLTVKKFDNGSFYDIQRTTSDSNYDPNNSTRKCRTLDNRPSQSNNVKDFNKLGHSTTQPPKFSLQETFGYHRPSIVQEMMNESGPETPVAIVPVLTRGMSVEKLDSAVEAEYGMRKRSATIAAPASRRRTNGTRGKKVVCRSISVAGKSV